MTNATEFCPDCQGLGVCNADGDPCWLCHGSGCVPNQATVAASRLNRMRDLHTEITRLRARNTELEAALAKLCDAISSDDSIEAERVAFLKARAVLAKGDQR